MMIFLGVICTLVGVFISAFLEPVSFAISVPIAIMGGFILKSIQDIKK